MKRNKALEEHFRKQEEKNGRPCDPDDLDALGLELLSDLQLEFASYVDDRYEGKARGKIPGQAMGGAKRPKKSIKQRLSGKQGRIRGNLLGKRVDFAARTVVVPDPNLALDEVGVPESIALGITKNVVVNPHNLEDLSECVALGKDVLGGAETVTTEAGQRIHLDRALCRPVLLPGMTVQRYLRDGDLVIVNRQPSLHRPSMMGHRIKIYRGMDRHPFGLNLSATAPYNADFDGDEMNMHVPQNVEAEAEVSQLMGANDQIVSGQSSAPVMGLVHDGALGAYLLSLPDAFLTPSQVGDLSVEAGFETDRLGEPAILKPQRLWTGKQVLAAVLPSDFRFQKTVGSHDPERSVRPVSETYPTRYRVVKFLVPQGSLVRKGQPLARICLLLDPADAGDEGPIVETETEILSPRDSATFKGLVPPGEISRCAISPIGELDDHGDKLVHIGVLEKCFPGEGDRIPGDESSPVAIVAFGEWKLPIRTRFVGTVSSVKIAPGQPVTASATILDVKVDGPYDADLSHHAIEISEGTFIRGSFARTNASVGRSANSVVHVLALTRGSKASADFLGAVQRICNRWFLGRGFSVGLKDVVPGAKAARKAKRVIERVEASVNNIYEEAEREGFDAGKIEPTVRNMLRGVVDAVGVEVSDDIPANNHIVLMKDAGSKGNTINLVQMMFCTGQQIVEGVRPSAKDPWSAILSCFQGGDNAPHARAFVKAALSQGLSFSEFFFYCMAGREGLCDTAVKTATTGYIERRLLKAMESLHFSHDGRVRNSLNQIVQDNFGDGGWDPAKLRKQSLDLLRRNDEELLRHLEGDRSPTPDQLRSELQTLRVVSRRRSEILSVGGRIDASVPDSETGLFLAPEPEWCRLKRLRDDCRACRLSGITPSLDSDVYLPFLARDVVSECELVSRRRSVPSHRHRICQPSVALKIVRAASERLRAQGFSAMAVRLAFEGCFTVRRICREWKLSQRELQTQIDKVVSTCEYARSDPGEMVGCVAAQSIGEPAQQVCLQTSNSGISGCTILTPIISPKSR
jgi:DNA-directed RNA polymerase beta' subunit